MIHSHRIVHFCGPKTEMVQGGTCADPECDPAAKDRLLAEARAMIELVWKRLTYSTVPHAPSPRLEMTTAELAMLAGMIESWRSRQALRASAPGGASTSRPSPADEADLGPEFETPSGEHYTAVQLANVTMDDGSSLRDLLDAKDREITELRDRLLMKGNFERRVDVLWVDPSRGAHFTGGPQGAYPYWPEEGSPPGLYSVVIVPAEFVGRVLRIEPVEEAPRAVEPKP